MRRLAALWLLAATTGPASAEAVLPAKGEVVGAGLVQPTDRYDHRVFGAAPLWGGLALSVNTCTGCAVPRLTVLVISLPADRVFEDTEARVADLDGDGQSEVVVVETDIARGATLAVYDAGGRRAATAPVGQTHRWLAPAGIGDFDGDGRVEVAYVDRPHLTRDLVFLRYEAGQLTELARFPGLTNHRFGDAAVSGGLRRCDGRDTLILATPDWRTVVEVWLQDGVLQQKRRGSNVAGALAAALDCG